MEHTSEQLKIFEFVKSTTGHGIIDAVAGSGKTSSIIDSAVHIPTGSKALFCAFNNSISKEINTRFHSKGMRGIVVKTIHALGFDLLKASSVKEYKLVNNKYEQIIERGLKHNEYDEFLLELLEINGLNPEPQNKLEEHLLRKFRFEFKSIASDLVNKFRLTLTKNDLESVSVLIHHYNILNDIRLDENTIREHALLYFEINKRVIEKGLQIANSLNEIDFSDMLYLPIVKGLTPRDKFDFLFIDECQDLSKSQLAIALKYVKQSGRVMAVGDPYQSIYGFTGADIDSFDNIKVKLDAISLSLSSCFRCPDPVIEMAKTFRSDIKSFSSKEGSVKWIEFKDVIQIAKPSNLIICRKKAPLQKLMFQMIEKGIQVEVHADEVKEFINDLKYLFTQEELKEYNPLKSNSFFDTVQERNLESIEKKSKRLKSIEEREDFIEEEKEILQTKIDFIRQQLIKQEIRNNISALLNKLEMLIAGGPNAIKLSTIHRAKGLENDSVFILEYDKLPLKREGQKEWEKRQESNLQYVALTRAKRELYLVRSEMDDILLIESSLFDSINDF